MDSTIERNKAAVRRFNLEVIERGDARAFAELMDPEFVNRTAMPGVSPGPEGMRHVFEDLLRPALPDLRVEIHDQVAEGDRVTTRKTLRGTHRGSLAGAPATGRAVAISVIDIVRLRDGRYLEHWGINDLAAVLASLRAAAADTT
jgi:predicted ester cyclase